MMMSSSRGYLRVSLYVLPCVLALFVQFIESLALRFSIMCVLSAFCIGSVIYELKVLKRIDRERAYLKKKVAVAERMAITDGLTGLYNYRYLRQYLDDDYLSALGDDFVLSIIMADVDCFKAYNDKYGHLEGDQLLRWLADLLKGSIRENDIVVRYGGEEFVIVLPGTDSDAAVQIAERIRSKIESATFMAERFALRGQVTVSFGIATYPAHAKTSDELLSMADKALYRAKQMNKNTVCLADSCLAES